MDKVLFRRILTTILIVCVLAYVIFQFANMNKTSSIETEDAVTYSVSDVIRTQGFVVRDETCITTDTDGEFSYNVNDGDNVSVGQNIADVYVNYSDAVARQEIKRINQQITALEQLGSSYFSVSVGLDTVNSQIDNEIIDILSDVMVNDFTSALSDSENLLYCINERQIVTGQVENFDEKINSLKAQIKDLEDNSSKKIKSVYAKKAGYFISNTDGYENTLSYNNITDVSLDDLNNYTQSKIGNNIIGKVVSNPSWYLVCKIDKDQALSLSKMQGKAMDIFVTMPFVSNIKMPANIVAVNQKTRQDDGVVVLSCDYMDAQIANARIEDVEIQTHTYSGLKVSKRAIYEDYVFVSDENGNTVKSQEKVQGVYVLYGSELIFKQISITYSSDNYVLCDPTPDEGKLINGETIQLYDQIVIKGDGLYNGKVVK